MLFLSQEKRQSTVINLCSPVSINYDNYGGAGVMLEIGGADTSIPVPRS